MTRVALEIGGRYRDIGAAFLGEAVGEDEEMALASAHLTWRVDSTAGVFRTTGRVEEELITEGDPETIRQGYLPGRNIHPDHQNNGRAPLVPRRGAGARASPRGGRRI